MKSQSELVAHKFETAAPDEVGNLEGPSAGGSSQELVPIIAELGVLRRAHEQQKGQLVGRHRVRSIGAHRYGVPVDLFCTLHGRKAEYDQCNARRMYCGALFYRKWTQNSKWPHRRRRDPS